MIAAGFFPEEERVPLQQVPPAVPVCQGQDRAQAAAPQNLPQAQAARGAQTRHQGTPCPGEFLGKLLGKFLEFMKKFPEKSLEKFPEFMEKFLKKFMEKFPEFPEKSPRKTGKIPVAFVGWRWWGWGKGWD